VRLLHTADWHIGKSLHGITRLDETRRVLDRIGQIAGDEDVDAILVAGDLLDRRLVDPASLGIALDALGALGDIAPVVAVPGNHDDPELWGHLAPLLVARNITMVARVLPPEQAVRDIDTAAGPLHVACLPWIETARLGLSAGAERGTARTTYAADLAAVVDAYAQELTRRRTGDGAPAVLLGHVMVDGSQTGAGERALTMALTYCLPTTSIPTNLDYIAFGHIHRPQPLPGVHAPGRYSGSPMALDFSEDNHAKSVTVIDLGGPPREIVIDSARPLARIRGRMDELPALAAAHPDAWLRCEVELDAPMPDLVREVRALLPDALRVDPVYPQVDAPVDDDAPDAADALGAVTEHYAAWYAQTGRRLDPRLADAFADALREAGGDA
jgi:DNA repair protein SbcD/Mre11